MTDKILYPMRKNGFKIINKEDGENTKKELEKQDTFIEN